MSIIELLLKETEQEAQITRKMLSIVPDNKCDWKPHPKSMSLMQLATHIAELPDWIVLALTTDGLDFASNPYVPTVVENTAELLEKFEKAYADGEAHLQAFDENKLAEPWTLRNGDHIIINRSRYETLRMTIAQTIHHRAQLGVYLRLLNIPIPGSYGPSADELESQKQVA
jgi:uncharacterized damage-inducible protein DinB